MYVYIFKDLAEDVRQSLTDDPMALEKIVRYHIAPGGERSCRRLYNNLELDTLDTENKILVKEYYSVYIYVDKLLIL